MVRHVSPAAGPVGTEADIIDVARSLIPQILAQRDACEALRRVSTPMVEALAGAGLLQMYLPRSMGGSELPPLVVFRAVEEISRADGSIGWCTMLSSVISSFTAWFDADVGRAMAGCPADLRLAGSIRPQGRARPVAGGYRIDGRWDFASGVNHARWLLCPCVIWDGNKPLLTLAGAPKVRFFFVPAKSITIQDTWHVLGMRGTGSHDFTITDTFVPDRHSFHTDESPKQEGVLYNPRLHLTWIWTVTVANAMGIARGALEAFVDLAARKASTTSTTLLRDRPLVQTRVAEAEAILSAARAYLHTAVGDLWARASQAETDLDAAVVQARLAITHGMHETARTVDLIFHAAGTNAIYERNPLERHFRNIHVALQHAAALPVHTQAAGKALLGLRPTDPGW
jgi:alkylation response protein AidB-like acyl-CoA dehydrogenase